MTCRVSLALVALVLAGCVAEPTASSPTARSPAASSPTASSPAAVDQNAKDDAYIRALTTGKGVRATTEFVQSHDRDALIEAAASYCGSLKLGKGDIEATYDMMQTYNFSGPEAMAVSHAAGEVYCPEAPVTGTRPTTTTSNSDAMTDAFIAALQQQNIAFKDRQDADILAVTVCVYLSQAGTSRAEAASGLVEWRPEYTRGEAREIVDAAIATRCPEEG